MFDNIFEKCVYPSGPVPATIMIVGEFPNEQELSKGAMYAGSIGAQIRKICQEAGIVFDSCFVTSVVRTRIKGNNIDNIIARNKTSIDQAIHIKFGQKYVTKQFLDGVAALEAEIAQVKPNIIIACGDLAMFALTEEWGTMSWRSSLMPGKFSQNGQQVKIIPTLSQNVVMGMWHLRPFVLHDFKRAKAEASSFGYTAPSYNFLIRSSFEETAQYLNSLLTEAKTILRDKGQRMPLSIDLETRAGHISCIGIARSAFEAISIPLMSVESPKGYWTLEEEAYLVFLIYQLFQVVRIIGQNFNYDAQYILRHWGFQSPVPAEDTMIKYHSCFSNTPKNLAFLSSLFCKQHLYWKDDRLSWRQGEDGEGEVVLWRYNATDAARTFEIDTAIDTLIAQMKLRDVADFQITLAPHVLKTMDKGIKIDLQKRAQFLLEIHDAESERNHWIKEALGHEINIRSPKQMSELFYDDFKQKPVFNANGGRTAGEEALHIIGNREPILAPLTKKILELRSLGVFASTFLQAPVDADGRIRTSFNICGTNTYRFASSKNAFGTGLNCQNIPNGSDDADGGFYLPNVRKIFTPDEDHECFDIDLDSADLRIVTWESDCQWMKEQFANGRKPYVEVAKEYYKDPTITKEHSAYALFKALCHGTNYLGTPAGLASRIGLLVHEVERIQKWYFGLNPEIRAWQEDLKNQVEKRKYIQNAFGYRIHFFQRLEGTIFNEAVAWIPQSTVGCLINRIYVNIGNNLPDVDVLLQVHDSLMGQYPIETAAKHKADILEQAQVVIPYEKPLIIPVGIKTSTVSWGDCAK